MEMYGIYEHVKTEINNKFYIKKLFKIYPFFVQFLIIKKLGLFLIESVRECFKINP